MSEWIWLFALIWIFLVVLGIMRNMKPIKGFAAFYGLVFSIIYLLRQSAILGMVIIALNLYLLYDSII